jgi:hypothetical protein
MPVNGPLDHSGFAVTLSLGHGATDVRPIEENIALTASYPRLSID